MNPKWQNSQKVTNSLQYQNYYHSANKTLVHPAIFSNWVMIIIANLIKYLKSPPAKSITGLNYIIKKFSLYIKMYTKTKNAMQTSVLQSVIFYNVPKRRFELPHPYRRQPLKLVRLPISPPGFEVLQIYKLTILRCNIHKIFFELKFRKANLNMVNHIL